MGIKLYPLSYPSAGDGIKPAFRQRGFYGGGGARGALWANSAELTAHAARAALSRPYDYTTWDQERYLYVGFWAFTYNHTQSTNSRPFVAIDTPTYNSGISHGPRYNTTHSKCEMYSEQWMAGYHVGYWDADYQNVLGDAGDGTGDFKVQEWHHFMIQHSWNGSMWVDGLRTWYNTNDGQTTWSTDPGSSNGIQNMWFTLGGAKSATFRKPATTHFGISNVCLFDPSAMVWAEFDDVTSIDPADSAADRFVAWAMTNVIDNSKSGMIYGYPLQEDGDDVGPYGKHMVLEANAFIATNNGTYDGPVF